MAVFTFRLIPPRSRAWTTTGKAAEAVGSPPPFTEATASTAGGGTVADETATVTARWLFASLASWIWPSASVHTVR